MTWMLPAATGLYQPVPAHVYAGKLQSWASCAPLTALRQPLLCLLPARHTDGLRAVSKPRDTGLQCLWCNVDRKARRSVTTATRVAPGSQGSTRPYLAIGCGRVRFTAPFDLGAHL